VALQRRCRTRTKP